VTAATAVLRQASARQRAGFIPVLALRPTAGVAAGLAFGVATGHVAAGVTLAVGALVVGVASLIARFKPPVIMLLLTAAATGLSTFAGSLSAHAATWLTVLLLAGWGFAAGLLVVLGQLPAVVATQAVVAYVVFGRFPLAAGAAADQGLLVAAGALVQVVLVSTFRGRGRFRAERRATAAAYAALATTALAPDEPGASLPAGEAIGEARAVVERSWAGPGSTAREVFRQLLGEAARLRLDLVALGAARTRLEAAGEDGLVAEIDAFRAAVRAALVGLAAVITEGAVATAADPPVPDDRALADLDAYAAWWAARSRMAAIAGQLRAVARITVPRDRQHTRGRPTPPQELRSAIRVLRSNLDPTSVTFRHAARLAVALPLAEILARTLTDRRGYWIPLTIVIVLKPDFATTTSRGIARVAGTAVGVSLASLVADGLHPTGWVLVAVVSLLAYASYGTLSYNYGLYAVFNAAFVVLLIGAVDPQPLTIAVDRLVETGIGGAIAFLAFLLYPAWSGQRLGPVVARLLDAQAAYAGAVLDVLAGAGDPAEVERLRSRARLARSNAETVLQRVDAEPASRRGDPGRARAVVGAAGRMVRASHELAALEGAGPPVPALRPFRRDLVTAITTLAQAATTAGVPGRLPDLRAAHDRLAGGTTLGAGADPADDARRRVLLAGCDQLVDSTDLARDALAGTAA
jgi:uncharacterized membrane protein YccC